MIRNPEALEVKDEGATQGLARVFDFVGGGVAASVSGQTATVTIAGGAGGGDSVTINGAALVDADFDDATPAPPAGEVNVKWQKDAGSPANVSASVQAATTVVKGVVELATDGEAAASVVVQGNDARMSNARTPTAHATSHQNGGSDEVTVVGLSGLLADGQTPLAHKTSHQDAGADEISVVGLSGLLADQQTPLIHDILTKHNGFPGGTSTFLRADATFAAAGGSGADPPEGSYAPGSYTIATGKFRIAAKRQQFTTTERLTIQGTGHLSLSN